MKTLSRPVWNGCGSDKRTSDIGYEVGGNFFAAGEMLASVKIDKENR